MNTSKICLLTLCKINLCYRDNIINMYLTFCTNGVPNLHIDFRARKIMIIAP